MVSVPSSPPPDPTLVAQQQAAQAQQVKAIGQSLSDQQLNMFRQFGQAQALGVSGSMFRSGTQNGGGGATPGLSPAWQALLPALGKP